MFGLKPYILSLYASTNKYDERAKFEESIIFKSDIIVYRITITLVRH